jgi:type IV pilus assembly protein PilO
MVQKKAQKIDVSEQFAKLQRQFTNLDTKDPSLWPSLPRYLLCLFIVVAVAAALWFVKLTDYEVELQTERATELTLREDYKKKLQKAVSLDALKKQREQVQQYVIQLEKQLPSKAEMAALLSDINQSGLGRSLQFELFRPGQVVVREYYAELPIAVRVTGRYHDMGAFASDIAHLSRIVTLNDVAIAAPQGKDKERDIANGVLVMDATARTFRYLDSEEIQAQRKTKTAATKTPAKGTAK